jgi:hypothetical protein
MIKRMCFAALLLVLVLAACTPLSTPTSSLKASTATSAAKLVGVTPLASGTLAASSATAVATTDSSANCTVSSSVFPTPNPTEASQTSLFKPVSDSDYVLGNKEASITFLEYGDFQ